MCNKDKTCLVLVELPENEQEELLLFLEKKGYRTRSTMTESTFEEYDFQQELDSYYGAG